MLRDTVISLGIEVGCPKVYLRNAKKPIPIGVWEKKYENELMKHEASASEFWSTIPYESSENIGTPNDSDDLEQTTSVKISSWLRYSFGSTFKHERFGSPENLSWRYDLYRDNPNNSKLATLFHELAILLPINNLDELMDRVGKIENHQISEVINNTS